MMNKILINVIFSFFLVGVYANELQLAQDRIESYNKCRLDTDCTKIHKNSFCHGNDAEQIGRCKCIEGYELLARNKTYFTCLKHATFGEACEADVQCQILLSESAVCDNTCRCADNSHRYTDGKCYKSILLGDICIADGNCWLDDNSFGYCVDGRCTCKYDNQVFKHDRKNCIRGRKLGQSCDNDNECSIVDNTVCRGVCKCAEGFALSRDERRCLKAATRFGSPCEENEQCSTFLEASICTSGNCSCPDRHHSYASRCVRTVALGETCMDQDECIPNDRLTNVADCIRGVCKCLPGAVNEVVGCSSSWNVRSTGFTAVMSLICIFYTKTKTV